MDDLMLYPGVLPMYEAKFDADTEGWSSPWDTGSSIAQADGALSILPAGDQTVVAMPASAPNATNIDWIKSLQVRMRIFLPAEYASDTDLYFQLFGQMGASWEWTNTAAKKIGDLVPGEWVEYEYSLTDADFPADFARTLLPNVFGLQYGGVSAGTIKIDDVEILGNTKVDNTQPELTEDFANEDQATAFAFDLAGGSQTESSLTSAKYWGYKVIPFGWMANTWIGSDSALDISTSENMVQLTTRGYDIVNGVGGISETTVPAGFE